MSLHYWRNIPHYLSFINRSDNDNLHIFSNKIIAVSVSSCLLSPICRKMTFDFIKTWYITIYYGNWRRHIDSCFLAGKFSAKKNYYYIQCYWFFWLLLFSWNWLKKSWLISTTGLMCPTGKVYWLQNLCHWIGTNNLSSIWHSCSRHHIYWNCTKYFVTLVTEPGVCYDDIDGNITYIGWQVSMVLSVEK